MTKLVLEVGEHRARQCVLPFFSDLVEVLLVAITVMGLHESVIVPLCGVHRVVSPWECLLVDLHIVLIVQSVVLPLL